MAKKDLKNGKYTATAANRICSKIVMDDIDSKRRGRRPKTKGIRQIVIETYHSKGILEAYKVLEEHNKKIGNTAFTREIFESWITEENRRTKALKKDNEIEIGE